MPNKKMHFFGIFALSLLLIGNDALALMWNDANVVPVQSISDHRWRDANTGRLINVQGMPGINPTPPPNNPAPGNSGGGNTGGGNTNTGNNTGSGNTGAGNTNTGGGAGGNTGGGRMAKLKSGATKVAKVGGAVLGTVGGAAMIYEGTKGQEEHSGWDVASGVGGGALAGASIGSVVPVIGTGIGAIGGAVVGGVITGSQLFSETDCLNDPITGWYTCCHTQFNQGQRNADIGEYMFCGIEQDGKTIAAAPGVRQCMQGGSAEKSSWWSGLWKDDAWTPVCTPRWCDTPPTDGIEQYIQTEGDKEKFCWNWDCIGGYTKSGDTCVASDTNTPVVPTDPYENVIKKIRAEQQVIIQRCGYTIGAMPNQ